MFMGFLLGATESTLQLDTDRVFWILSFVGYSAFSMPGFGSACFPHVSLYNKDLGSNSGAVNYLFCG